MKCFFYIFLFFVGTQAYSMFGMHYDSTVTCLQGSCSDDEKIKRRSNFRVDTTKLDQILDQACQRHKKCQDETLDIHSQYTSLLNTELQPGRALDLANKHSQLFESLKKSAQDKEIDACKRYNFLQSRLIVLRMYQQRNFAFPLPENVRWLPKRIRKQVNVVQQYLFERNGVIHCYDQVFMQEDHKLQQLLDEEQHNISVQLPYLEDLISIYKDEQKHAEIQSVVFQRLAQVAESLHKQKIKKSMDSISIPVHHDTSLHNSLRAGMSDDTKDVQNSLSYDKASGVGMPVPDVKYDSIVVENLTAVAGLQTQAQQHVINYQGHENIIKNDEPTYEESKEKMSIYQDEQKYPVNQSISIPVDQQTSLHNSLCAGASDDIKDVQNSLSYDKASGVGISVPDVKYDSIVVENLTAVAGLQTQAQQPMINCQGLKNTTKNGQKTCKKSKKKVQGNKQNDSQVKKLEDDLVLDKICRARKDVLQKDLLDYAVRYKNFLVLLLNPWHVINANHFSHEPLEDIIENQRLHTAYFEVTVDVLIEMYMNFINFQSELKKHKSSVHEVLYEKEKNFLLNREHFLLTELRRSFSKEKLQERIDGVEPQAYYSESKNLALKMYRAMKDSMTIVEEIDNILNNSSSV